MVKNGRLSCSHSSLVNSICTIQCNKGFVNKGSKSKVCLENRRWTGNDYSCES